MKHTMLSAVLIALIALSAPAFAQSEPVPSAAVANANPPVVEVENEEGDDTSGTRITIDFDDDEEGAEDVSNALKKLDETFGTSLTSKFNDLDENEVEKLQEVFGRHHVNLGTGGLGAGEFVIAVLAISLSLGLPVIILLMVFIFGYRKRKQKLQLISSYLEAGEPVPDQVMGDFESKHGGDQQFHSGVRFLLGAAAFALFCLFMGDSEVMAIAVIPLAIGAAKLISWRFEKGKGGS